MSRLTTLQLTGEFTEAAVMHLIGGNHTYLAAQPSVSNYRRLRMIGLESERVGATPEGEVGTTRHVPAVLAMQRPLTVAGKRFR